jgi:hypothetical protein
LHAALRWLEEKVAEPWRAADQRRCAASLHHSTLARIAIVTAQLRSFSRLYSCQSSLRGLNG